MKREIKAIPIESDNWGFMLEGWVCSENTEFLKGVKPWSFQSIEQAPPVMFEYEKYIVIADKNGISIFKNLENGGIEWYKEDISNSQEDAIKKLEDLDEDLFKDKSKYEFVEV